MIFLTIYIFLFMIYTILKIKFMKGISIVLILLDLLNILIIEALLYLSFLKYNLLIIFILLNIWIMFYFFVRVRLPGKSWQLILENKHNKRLDTLMVVMGLIFTAAFGAITSLEIDDSFFENYFLIVGIYFIFISANIVILSILSMITVYVINTMGARKPIMISLVIFMGLGMFVQEIVNFDKSYKNYMEKYEKIKR